MVKNPGPSKIPLCGKGPGFRDPNEYRYSKVLLNKIEEIWLSTRHLDCLMLYCLAVTLRSTRSPALLSTVTRSLGVCYVHVAIR